MKSRCSTTPAPIGLYIPCNPYNPCNPSYGVDFVDKGVCAILLCEVVDAIKVGLTSRIN